MSDIVKAEPIKDTSSIPPRVSAAISFIQHCNNEICIQYEESLTCDWPKRQGRELSQQERFTYDMAIKFLGQYFTKEWES